MRNVVEYFRQDLRYAARQLGRAPLFTAVSTFSLGIGIAVAVTVYSLINSVLFKPIPIKEPSRLVTVFTTDRAGDQSWSGSSYADIPDYEATRAFDGVAAEFTFNVKVAANNFAPAYISTAFVSSNYFDVLGLRLKVGRAFSKNGDLPEIILSERYVSRMFKRGEPVIGSTVRVRDIPYTVIGIAPRDFRGTNSFSNTVAWLPRGALSWYINSSSWLAGERRDRLWSVKARLAPGVSEQVATARMNALAQNLAQRFPRAWTDFTRHPSRVKLLNPREYVFEMFGKDLPLMIATLGALIGVVLILACTNVAGLLLARALGRRHEIAVRLTLGANRRQLVAQLLTESLLLALIGGAFGIFLSMAGVRLAGTSSLFDSFDLTPDWRVVTATLMTCVVCAVVFGLTPALQTLNVDLKSGLTGRSVIGERGGVRSRLMALQVSLAFLLIVIGFSASRGIRSHMQSAPGFAIDGILVIENQVQLRDTVEQRAYLQTSLDLIRSIPGVTHAVVTEGVPAEGGLGWDASIETPKGRALVGVENVDVDYFPTIGMRLVAGRLPRPGDAAGARPVALVDRTLIDKVGHNVVGGSLKIGNDQEVLVIGVVEGVRRSAADNALRPYVYPLRVGRPALDKSRFIITSVNAGSERDVSAEITRRMRARYPNLVPPGVMTLRSRLQVSLAPQRYMARIAYSVGMIQLALAAVGLYSLLLYATLARTREIGIRMALGAPSGKASFTVMKEGLVYVLGGSFIGVALGAVGAFYAGRIFVGTHATDPVPFIAAIAATVCATSAAMFIPARIAARVQPMEALRHE